jgi:hypothetical protein
MNLNNLGTGKRLVQHVLSSKNVKNWTKVHQQKSTEQTKNPLNPEFVKKNERP